LELLVSRNKVLKIHDFERRFTYTVLHVKAGGDGVDEDLDRLREARPNRAVKGNRSINVPNESRRFGELDNQFHRFLETPFSAKMQWL
jgi:hypothetical protein